MLEKLRQALNKTTALFSRTKGASVADIEEILLQADVGAKYTELILQKIINQGGDRSEILKSEITKLLDIPKPKIEAVKPKVVMVSGVNGSGKTTTVAKLANLYSKTENVILACGDTYRDAASEQLEIWAARASVEIVTSQKGQDAAAVVFDALSKAQAKSVDTVLVDTAGRLHTRNDLMEELKKIQRVVTKLKQNGPELNILTIDANLGLNSIQQARVFKQTIGVNGLILTKFDGTAKGGAIIPIGNELKLPVLYLGVGEEIDDIVEFDSQSFVEALFD
jgi:fused signal recognition particle receptor